jgi:hypothetical protein
MENEKKEIKDQEIVEVTKIAIQIHFNNKYVKECVVPHEVLVKVADILYEYEDKRDKENKEGIYKEKINKE